MKNNWPCTNLGTEDSYKEQQEKSLQGRNDLGMCKNYKILEWLKQRMRGQVRCNQNIHRLRAHVGL